MILNFFENFHNRAAVLQGANSSFLVLIPKKNDPESWKDFRPISLINCSFKILLKVLVNRLKSVLNRIISKDQHAFLKGRNISESIFMVNEVIHTMKTQKVDDIILKIDFLKAYDIVDWSCLLHIVDCTNLRMKWSNWIRIILETTRMSILVNGSPT